MKIEINGYVLQIHPAKENAKRDGYYQKIVIKKPARTDDFGEKVGYDQYYPITAFGKKPLIIDPKITKGQKVKVQAYLNGNIENEATTKEFFSLNITLKEIQAL